jgi:hypothetical protein
MAVAVSGVNSSRENWKNKCNGCTQYKTRQRDSVKLLADFPQLLAGSGSRRVSWTRRATADPNGHTTDAQQRAGKCKHQWFVFAQPDELRYSGYEARKGGTGTYRHQHSG